MDQVVDEDGLFPLRWILELFAPVTGPTRQGNESVRFGIGEFDTPEMFFSRWAVMRGLVWSLKEVAPTAWHQLTVLQQEALDGMRAQRATPEEPDRLDQFILAEAAMLCREAGLALEIPGLRAAAEEMVASTHQLEPLIDPNPEAFRAWQERWNLGDERSLFTVALYVAAFNETDLAQRLPAEAIALRTYRALFQWRDRPPLDEVPSVEPPQAEPPEATSRLEYPQDLSFEFRQFNPFFETEAQYKVKARAALDRAIATHVAACRVSLEAQGLAAVLIKRDPEKHFRWYIQYQVLGQSHSEIADAECARETADADCPDDDAVSFAIRQLVRFADLPKREPNRPGPRKKRSSSRS